ncbi:MAG: hypothetical protein JXB20_04565 [Bacilli bacterium]|nr:hypothetical protein [Bacilli bacterium]
MKKFFGNLVIILSLLLVSLVAIPWNNLSQWWGLTVPVLSDNELYIKAGIGGLMLIFGIIFLIVANREHRNYGHVTPKTAGAAFLPMWSYAIAGLIYALVIMLFVYSHTGSQSDLMILAGVGFVLLNVMVFGHMMSAGFRKQRNLGRVLLFILLFELMALAMGAAYFMRMIVISDQFYASMYTYLYIGVLGVTLILAIVHIIIVKSKSKKRSEEVELEAEIDSIRETRPAAVSQAQPKGTKKSQPVVTQAHDGKKTMIVSKEQTIVSGEQNLDPTQMLYEDVAVDPEFSKTTNQEKQVSSIEYYIEKPKMFKPLDPTFDQLVEYVRELPQVVTKIADEKITFYVDRRPFLVLMNYGNYYRMAFKYELEKGIRLIIKYPTISKNKSSRDELWFKANNYGDLPKEVVYQIVKSAYDNVNA